LSYYTQADKWSNMGISSLTAIFTQSFLPALSQFQDDPRRFAASTAKMNRFTSYLLFPCCGLAIIVTTALFHLCFGTKWDAAIYLFQLLMLRGIFTVLSSLYNNYILALGRSRLIIVTELLRDSAALIAIALTWPFIALETTEDPTLGIAILLWGQIGASALTWGVTLIVAARLSGRNAWQFVADSLPYAATALISVTLASMLTWLTGSPLLLTIGQLSIGAALYMGLNKIAGSRIQSEVIDHFRSRFVR
ncbi:MAG: oligosaccharide flippase family protein, partial [Paramuribaculum sp.]|nr:oligosaccharide flippase family protein [Paramuribaculum sp.]